MRFTIITFFFMWHTLYAMGQDSCHLRISLLTISAGEELYSTFGHSALRVTDSTNQTDIVYNYGTFNFDEPGFYTKFIRGNLLYYLSTDDYTSFSEYAREAQRGMTEQVLNLNCHEKQNIFSSLQKNLSGTNKYYKYDFAFDNCTTRLRDLLERAVDSPVVYRPVVKQQTSYRELIYVYLNKNDKQWSKLGIDALLGSRTDAIMNIRQAMFLPDYLMYSFDSSRVGLKQIVTLKHPSYPFTSSPVVKNFLIDPVFIFSSILLLFFFLARSRNAFAQRCLIAFDGLIFFTVGLTGILILIMWFGTEHLMCRDNFNILWAWPTHSVAAFFIHGKTSWVKRYFRITAIVNLALLVVWFFLPQHLNVAFIPIVILMIYRGLTAESRML